MELKDFEAQKQRLVALRRDFHRHPDMTGHEEATIERIAGILKEDHIPFEIVPDGGILAYIYGTGYEPKEGCEPWKEGYVEDGDKTLFASNRLYGPEGTLKPGAIAKTTQTWKMKTVLLRADVDALPVPESPVNLKGPKCCLSENEGLSHACGHDAHIAMLLGAAEYLNAHRDEINGRVILMFERGEEGPNNITELMHRIIEKNLHIDTAYGTHIYYALESGKLAVQPGPVMAGGVFFTVKLIGRGGHGSRPDMAANPIDCYVALNIALNGFRMLQVDPFHTLTYAPTMVQAGSVDNVIPEELTFGGNMRIYDLEDGIRFKEYFHQALESVCSLYDCSYEIRYCIGPKVPVRNDDACALLASQAAGRVLGSDAIVTTQPWMACETFCAMLAIVPGVFTLLGTKNPETGSGALHHSAAFDIDEDVLPLGAAAAAAYAESFLRDAPAPSRGWYEGGAAELYTASGYEPATIDRLRF